jgi:hypothetical protein
MKCGNCVHKEYRDKLLRVGFAWGSTQPHPCTICSRFPTKSRTFDMKQEPPKEVRGE